MTQLGTTTCESLALDNSGANLVCSNGFDAVIISSDSGQTFTSVNVYGGSTSVSVIGASAYNGNQYIYLPQGPSAQSLVASSNNGKSWSTKTVTSNNNADVRGTGVSGNGQQVYLATFQGIYYTTDAGSTWT